MMQVLGRISMQGGNRLAIASRSSIGIRFVSARKTSQVAQNVSTIDIRPVKRQELQKIHGLLLEKDCIPTYNSMVSCYMYDPEGMLAAVKGDGEIVGCISNTLMANSMRYCHTFFVKEDYQKSGLGKLLLQSTLNYTKTINVIADALLPQVDRFCKWTGCQASPSINRMYIGTADHKQINNSKIADGISIQKFSSDILSTLKAYDRSIHGLDRDQFLVNWVNPDFVTTLIATSGNDIIGYGCIQPDRNNQYLGPLYADNDIVAESLLRHLLLSVPDGQVVTYYAENNMDLNVTKKVFGTVEFDRAHDACRIFSRDPFHLPSDKMYVLSFYFV